MTYSVALSVAFWCYRGLDNTKRTPLLDEGHGKTLSNDSAWLCRSGNRATLEQYEPFILQNPVQAANNKQHRRTAAAARGVNTQGLLHAQPVLAADIWANDVLNLPTCMTEGIAKIPATSR